MRTSDHKAASSVTTTTTNSTVKYLNYEMVRNEREFYSPAKKIGVDLSKRKRNCSFEISNISLAHCRLLITRGLPWIFYS
jgi:hypothetical protein